MLFIILLSVCGAAAGRSLLDTKSSEQKCGVEASANPLHHNPWLVFIEYYRHGEPRDSRCGGTLISSRHIVTAAHCVKNGLTPNSGLIARLGEYDLTSEVDCMSGACAHLPVKIRVASVTLHPLYDGKEHDIAILTLAHEAPYTDYKLKRTTGFDMRPERVVFEVFSKSGQDTIRPVCLPTGHIQDDVVFTASGWGEESIKGVYSNIKKNLFLPYWPTNKCLNTYRNLSLPKHIICAGGERGIDTCRGDSGGPLTWTKDRTELWGVTSTGNVVCGTRGYPGIYTSVVDYLEWIEEVIEK